jgi:hypothetical protein
MHSPQLFVDALAVMIELPEETLRDHDARAAAQVLLCLQPRQLRKLMLLLESSEQFSDKCAHRHEEVMGRLRSGAAPPATTLAADALASLDDGLSTLASAEVNTRRTVAVGGRSHARLLGAHTACHGRELCVTGNHPCARRPLAQGSLHAVQPALAYGGMHCLLLLCLYRHACCLPAVFCRCSCSKHWQ